MTMSSPQMPIVHRAAIRGAITAGVLFIAFGGLIALGKTTKISLGEAAMISAVSGAVYAGLWSVFAMATKRMLQRIEDAAKGDSK